MQCSEGEEYLISQLISPTLTHYFVHDEPQISDCEHSISAFPDQAEHCCVPTTVAKDDVKKQNKHIKNVIDLTDKNLINVTVNEQAKLTTVNFDPLLAQDDLNEALLDDEDTTSAPTCEASVVGSPGLYQTAQYNRAQQQQMQKKAGTDA